MPWVMLMILIRTIGVVVPAQRVGAKIDFTKLRRRHERVLGPALG